MSGFIVIDRKILDWQFYRNSSAVHLWITILLKANWKDGKLYEEEIPRGSFATSIASLAQLTGLSESTIRRWLKRFEEAGMIELKTTNRWTTIKVLNYSTFQDIDGDKVTKRMTKPMTEQVTKRMTERVNNDRTKKQEEQSNNIPPYIPPRGDAKKRRGRSGIRIDTPEWYKKQQSGDLDVSEADPEETEAIIAEIEDLKRRINEQ